MEYQIIFKKTVYSDKQNVEELERDKQATSYRFTVEDSKHLLLSCHVDII